MNTEAFLKFYTAFRDDKNHANEKAKSEQKTVELNNHKGLKATIGANIPYFR